MAVLVSLFGFCLLSLAAGQSIEIIPKEVVVKIGGEVKVVCKVAYPIDSCRMRVGNTTYRMDPKRLTDDVAYHGQGYQFGECGAHIRNVQESWNGNVECFLPPPPSGSNAEPSATMKLIVARPPSNPQLISTNTPTFKEGDILLAQCVVADGRPVAKISWFVDDQPLLVGLYKPIITRSPNSDLDTISQNVSLGLTANEDNRRLVCKVEHDALTQPKFAARSIIVHYPPKGLETGTITIFGLKIDSEGRLNVTVRANPPPRVEWTVGDEKLTPSRSNADGSVMALEPVGLGGGFYNISLKLASVKKEDVDRPYYLDVNNEYGEEKFIVRLSTLDEPAGVELGTGAILGIVIAVLLVLIAVCLTVFAKATDRWCFGAASRREAKGSGESSDTESAAGVKPERSRLAELTARVRAVLPKSKPQATELQNIEGEDKDEKKSIVYAELTLQEGSKDKPNPASSEYAEIVYSTPQEGVPAAENKEK